MDSDGQASMQPSGGNPTPHRPPRILILGGTSEASRLAARLAGRTDLITISSLAGRLSEPTLPAGVVRVGGFGGVTGLTSYLLNERISVVIDATHPFASRISFNAEMACKITNVPLISFERLAWKPLEQDCWLHVPNMQAAASLVNREQHRVFLSIGRQELGAFSNCEDAWFLIRAIDEPQYPLPPRSKLILDRGPFTLNHELNLLRDESIGYVVSKNSGGAATYSKIEASRILGIPIVMIDRPLKHTTPTVAHLDEVLLRLAEFRSAES
jgi:precorrin-6A/cobalt-precorrin-6A reductase